MNRSRKLSALAVLLTALGTTMGTAGAASAKTLRASMDGRQEVPKGDPDGRGSAVITTDRARGRVCFRITMTKVGTVAAGHIHKGARGKAGGVVVSLFAKPTGRPSGCAKGVSKALIRDLERNPSRYYVNVHNARHPGGAVRGQLRG